MPEPTQLPALLRTFLPETSHPAMAQRSEGERRRPEPELAGEGFAQALISRLGEDALVDRELRDGVEHERLESQIAAIPRPEFSDPPSRIPSLPLDERGEEPADPEEIFLAGAPRARTRSHEEDPRASAARESVVERISAPRAAARIERAIDPPPVHRTVSNGPAARLDVRPANPGREAPPVPNPASPLPRSEPAKPATATSQSVFTTAQRAVSTSNLELESPAPRFRTVEAEGEYPVSNPRIVVGPAGEALGRLYTTDGFPRAQRVEGLVAHVDRRSPRTVTPGTALDPGSPGRRRQLESVVQADDPEPAEVEPTARRPEIDRAPRTSSSGSESPARSAGSESPVTRHAAVRPAPLAREALDRRASGSEVDSDRPGFFVEPEAGRTAPERATEVPATTTRPAPPVGESRQVPRAPTVRPMDADRPETRPSESPSGPRSATEENHPPPGDEAVTDRRASASPTPETAPRSAPERRVEAKTPVRSAPKPGPSENPVGPARHDANDRPSNLGLRGNERGRHRSVSVGERPPDVTERTSDPAPAIRGRTDAEKPLDSRGSRTPAPPVETPQAAEPSHRAAPESRAPFENPESDSVPESDPVIDRPPEHRTQSGREEDPESASPSSPDEESVSPRRADPARTGSPAREASDVLPPAVPAHRIPRPAPVKPPLVSGSGVTAGHAESILEPSSAGGGPVRLPPASLAEAIVARARVLPRNGAMELRFALEPQDLGLVRVRIESRGDELKIRILVSSGAAAEAIGSGISRLGTQLSEAGFKQPQIDLVFEDALDPGGYERKYDPAPHRRSSRGPRISAASFHGSAPPDPGARPSRGRLDRIA